MTDVNMELAHAYSQKRLKLLEANDSRSPRERVLSALDNIGWSIKLSEAQHAADAVIFEFGLTHTIPEGAAMAKNLRLTQLRCSELTLHRRSLRERLAAALYDLHDAHVALGDEEMAKKYSDALEDFRQECEDVR